MPTIFLASSVQPDFRPLNPAVVTGSSVSPTPSNCAEALSSSDGRTSSRGRSTTCFPRGHRRPHGIRGDRHATGALDRLGSTRLLAGDRVPLAAHRARSAAARQLLRGRIRQPSRPGVPTTLRGVVAEILQQAVAGADKFGLPPPRLRALAPTRHSPADVAVTGAAWPTRTPAGVRRRPAVRCTRSPAIAGAGNPDAGASSSGRGSRRAREHHGARG